MATIEQKIRLAQWKKENPEKVKAADLRHYRKNREKLIAKSEKWAKENPEKHSLYQRKSQLRVLGWTLEKYEEKSAEQDNKCAICGKHKDALKRTLHADHSHTTKNTRGLLCGTCNPSLGGFEGRIDILEAAIDYLRKYGEG